MVQSNISKIANIIIHIIGNKTNEETLRLSSSEINIHEDVKELLKAYFFSSFKSEEYFNFYHNIDISMNEVFICGSKIFDSPEALHEQSINLAKHLYEQSTHPKIKGGEFYVVYFKECVIDGKTVDAIGLFKSENKDTFLKVYPSGDNFEIESQQGVNINKLDKGCLIFNTEKENGYVVAVVDNTNKGVEAQYWLDDFLHVRQRKDEYYNTQNILSLCKNFIKNELPEQFEVSKADQADLINKSVKFFKENESFNMDKFAKEVIGQNDIIESFRQFKAEYQKEQEISISDSFEISESAVKKGTKTLKSIIKLDKNFDIHIHGNRDLIEQGVDEKGKYYKVYYKEEA
ncbi:nucleoid-associated protein [Parabacteroides sp. 52]|uniref:nucleoid-associated protein n=1 Tax=unclassified Parabacteroides TaxID=2649774 RepID=UPI0013D87F66|nr:MULTISPECIES: nucleoid-associated protein [unclassified Parabacteroides]MDH6534575.1 hypothetical protein [Parabacteroides sp. PM5-20]NDV55191.1 nucleoid-associated protein [Parabacteroides sp. 52]